MKRLLTLLSWLLLLQTPVSAQHDGVIWNYEHLSRNDGLSGNRVTALCDDAYGRIWIGTSQGLNIYDGRRLQKVEEYNGLEVWSFHDTGDRILIAASAIPGNEKSINNMVNELYKQGAEVIYDRSAAIHVSGHACQEEIKLLHALVKPKYFLPIHGEYSKLWQHAELAEALGTRSENIVIPEIGQVIEMSQDSLAIVGEVPTGGVLVDGLGIGDVGNVVLRDRKHLSQDGLIIVVMAIDRDSGALVSGPDIISRGFIYVRENEDIIENTRDVVRQILSQSSLAGEDWPALKNRIKDELHRFIFEKIKRNPMILPIILDV